MSEDDRNALLQAKEAEFERHLASWAEGASLLSVGEVLVFGPLRIEKIATVRPDETPMATEELAIKGRKGTGRKFEFVRPARMTTAQIDLLVDKLKNNPRKFI